MKDTDIMFAGEPTEPYREQVSQSDPRITELASHAVMFAMQELKDEVLDDRIAEYSALLGYFEDIASHHDGAVPIGAVRDILRKALQAEI